MPLYPADSDPCNFVWAFSGQTFSMPPSEQLSSSTQEAMRAMIAPILRAVEGSLTGACEGKVMRRGVGQGKKDEGTPGLVSKHPAPYWEQHGITSHFVQRVLEHFGLDMGLLA